MIKHIWKVVVRDEQSYFLIIYAVFEKKKRFTRERGSFSIHLSYDTWLLHLALRISPMCHLPDKTWALVNLSFLVCGLGCTMPCQPAGRLLGRETRGKWSDVHEVLPQTSDSQGGQLLSDTLCNIPYALQTVELNYVFSHLLESWINSLSGTGQSGCFLEYVSVLMNLVPRAGGPPVSRCRLLGLVWGLWAVIPTRILSRERLSCLGKSETPFPSAEMAACWVWTRKALPKDFFNQFLPLRSSAAFTGWSLAYEFFFIQLNSYNWEKKKYTCLLSLICSWRSQVLLASG